MPGRRAAWPGREWRSRAVGQRADRRPPGRARPAARASTARAGPPAERAAAPAEQGRRRPRKSKPAGKDARRRRGARPDVAATYKEPEVVSGADTVMLPKLKPRQTTRRRPDDDRKKTARPAPPARSARTARRLEVDDQLTTIMPAQTMPLSVADPARPEQPYSAEPAPEVDQPCGAAGHPADAGGAVTPAAQHGVRRRGAVPVRRTAGNPVPVPPRAPLPLDYASYFSGAPVLYPVLGAAANDVGGLAAARAVSLAGDAGHDRAALHDQPAALQRAGGHLRGAAVLGHRVRDVPGPLRHLRRELPVPAGRWRRGSWCAPRCPAGRCSCSPRRWPRSRWPPSTRACCSSRPSRCCPC